MPPKPEHALKHKVTVYDSQDVISNDQGELFLQVVLAGHTLLLPALLVPDGKSTIFYFNPENQQVREAAVITLVLKLQSWIREKNVQLLRLLTPRSKKSEPMIEEVQAELSQTYVCNLTIDMFPKAQTRSELLRLLGPDAIIVRYSPITKKSKYIGISQENAALLRAEQALGMELVLIDDIVSSGATMEALKMILEVVFAGSNFDAQNVPVFAVMIEQLAGQAPPTQPELHYGGVLPVFTS